MKKRFRMIAGPNGSGKSMLQAWLRSDCAVNFYTVPNAVRYARSLAQLPAALPHLSRAFFFDNSANDMLYLGESDEKEV